VKPQSNTKGFHFGAEENEDYHLIYLTDEFIPPPKSTAVRMGEEAGGEGKSLIRFLQLDRSA
jgi:hypothetical protein